MQGPVKSLTILIAFAALLQLPGVLLAQQPEPDVKAAQAGLNSSQPNSSQPGPSQVDRRRCGP